MYKIRSKHDGFRRCGIAHSKKGEIFPNNFFSEDQLDILKTDPMISVIYIEETESKTGPGPEIKPEIKPEITKPKIKAKKIKTKGK